MKKQNLPAFGMMLTRGLPCWGPVLLCFALLACSSQPTKQDCPNPEELILLPLTQREKDPIYEDIYFEGWRKGQVRAEIKNTHEALAPDESQKTEQTLKGFQEDLFVFLRGELLQSIQSNALLSQAFDSLEIDPQFSLGYVALQALTSLVPGNERDAALRSRIWQDFQDKKEEAHEALPWQKFLHVFKEGEAFFRKIDRMEWKGTSVIQSHFMAAILAQLFVKAGGQIKVGMDYCWEGESADLSAFLKSYRESETLPALKDTFLQPLGLQYPYYFEDSIEEAFEVSMRRENQQSFVIHWPLIRPTSKQRVFTECLRVLQSRGGEGRRLFFRYAWLIGRGEATE